MADNRQTGETLKSALDLSARYYAGLLELSTGYLQALGALVAKKDGGTPAPPQRSAPAPLPPLLLAGTAGEDAAASFLVENTLAERVTARLVVRASGPAGRLAAHPEVVALNPGEQCVIQARVRIDTDMPVGQDLFGELAVPELASRTIPFVIRRLPDPAPAPEPADAPA